MSAPAFAWALDRGQALGLLPAERLVLIYLADMANGARVCWPGQETIARFTGLALKTIRAAIRRLAERDLIRVETSPGKATRYHILRDPTPANGHAVNPGKSSHTTRVRRAGVATPANRHGEPRQNVPTNPGTSGQEPRNIRAQTPANGCPDPSYTQEKTQDAREDAREGSVVFFDRKKDGTPPAQPDDFNAWVDRTGSKTAKPVTIEGEVVRGPVIDAEREPTAGEIEASRRRQLEELRAAGASGSIATELGKRLRHIAYAPGRFAQRSPRQQIIASLDDPLPPPNPALLSTIQAAREALAKHARAHAGSVAA